MEVEEEVIGEEMGRGETGKTINDIRLPLITEFQSAQVPFHIRRLPWSMLYHLVP